MRRIERLSIAFCFALMACTVGAADSGQCGENVRWSYDNDTFTIIIEGSGSMTEYTSEVDVPWKDVRAFIKNATIKEGVSSIAPYAFSHCESLTNVTIPSSVTSIGNKSFYRCFDLESIEIPSNVISIGRSAFNTCKSLRSIVIPSSVTSIGLYAFQKCNTLTSVALPSNITSIESCVFVGCTSLTGIELPSTITSIGSFAFEDCVSLTTIEIPPNVTSIEQSTFNRCKSLTNITFPSNLTTIGDNAFRMCSSLDNVTIPSTVEAIGAFAFGECSSLSNLTISNGVKKIAFSAFYGSNLTTMTIPSSVTSIGTHVFSYCHNLTSINVDSNNSAYMSVDGVLFKSKEMALIHFPRGREGKYVIPNNVTRIEDFSFEGSYKLTSVVIPSNVISIGDAPFESCTSLESIEVEKNNGYFKSIEGVLFTRNGTLLIQYPCGKNENYTIPNNVTTIGIHSFARCSYLKNVSISSDVTSIQNNAFEECTNLTTITIPSSVTSIEYPFSGCINLKSIIVDANNTSYKDIDGVLFDKNGTKLIQYPCGHSSNYTIPDNVTCIGESSFFKCTGLSSVTIPENDNDITIEHYAFNTVNMAYVNYLRLNAPKCADNDPTSTFAFVDVICVRSDYKSGSSFCGRYGVKVKSCEEFVAQQNQCYEVLEWQTEDIVVKKRANATLWDERTNNCFEYHCYNSSGGIAWSKCNSTVGVHRVCINNECVVEDKILEERKYAVEMIVNITPSEYDLDILKNELVTIAELPEDQLLIASEVTNRTGNVIRIIAYVDNEKTADTIRNAVKECAPQDSQSE